MRDEVGIRGQRRSWTSEVVDDTLPLAHGTLLALADFFKTLATVLALSEFGDVALDTLLGDLSLDFAGRALCVDNGNFVFVYP